MQINRLIVLLLVMATAGCHRRAARAWQLTNVTGYLPDLQFRLATDGERRITPEDFQGKIVLLYFGYTHCPDVCPATLARLAVVLRGLGGDAQQIRLLFVSVDPQRDTPRLAEIYARAFSPEAVGTTGSPAEIETLARRYRVAYQPETPGRNGDYLVTHSKAVYVFDRRGHARLLITDGDSNKKILHDLRQLLQS